ncbi:MAG: hypothetical protein Kow0029_25080 [Candidatus Rifleibacteriota bacterium]
MSYLEQTFAVEIKDTRISFSVAGKGQPILFLHGNPGSRKDFSALTEYIASDSYKCIFLDRPGHMGSEEIIYDRPDFWLETEIYAEFIDRKASGKTWLVGYSLGCFTAAKIAIKYPEKVEGIIFIAPYLVPDNKAEKPSSIPDLAKGAVLGTLLGVLLPILSQKKMTEHLKKVFLPAKLPEEYLETWLPRYTRFETLMAMMNDKNSMLNILDEVHQEMSKIDCPVYTIIGKDDKVCSAQKQIDLIREKIPGNNLIELENAGHGLPITNAKECADVILKALKSQD